MGMTSTAEWGLILGAVLPLLIAVIQRPGWPSWVRTVVMAVVCIVGALVNVQLDGSFSSAKGVVAQVLLVIVAAMAFYEKFWKPLGLAGAIETATSPTPPVFTTYDEQAEATALAAHGDPDTTGSPLPPGVSPSDSSTAPSSVTQPPE